MTDNRKLCFVVMGFGKKTDFETGRLLDLNATYEAIIHPAVDRVGLRCIRADEIMHSGVIDTEMYEMLLRADLVIADISTANVNAIYELGVRHALRPNSTIIMKESDGRFHFDLNHIATFNYKHLGEDIGSREATRASAALESLVRASLVAGKPDSPVYTYLPKLQSPKLSDEQFAKVVRRLESDQDHLDKIMQTAVAASKASDHQAAANAYSAANQIKPNDSFIIQQFALTTYKSKQPSVIEALFKGLTIIKELQPEKSNDPETRGITGAIYKRIWQETNKREYLDAAILHYGRGYEFRRDYYNGENLAACYDFRASIQDDEKEKEFDRMSAKKVRESIITELKEALKDPNFSERSDRRWVYATLANCLYAIGDSQEGESQEKNFRDESPTDWELETFEIGKRFALSKS